MTGNGLSFLGLGPTQPVTYQGVLASASGTSVVDSSAVWTNNQFNGSDATHGTYFLELTTGTGVGIRSKITATDSADKTLTLADDLSGKITNGTGYKIRKNWTVATVFGANNEAGLGAGDVTGADKILILDPITQGYTSYYYATADGLGGAGWRTDGDPYTSQSEAELPLERGILVKRQQATSLTLTLAGSVKMGTTVTSVSPAINIVGNLDPSGKLTLGSSKLYTGDQTTGVKDGDVTSADEVLFYRNDPVNPGYNGYYYAAANSLGGAGWRQNGDPFTDASGVSFPIGTSFIIKRQGGLAFNWSLLQQFQLFALSCLRSSFWLLSRCSVWVPRERPP